MESRAKKPRLTKQVNRDADLSLFTSLPSEILLHVLSFLTLKELMKLIGPVCRYLHLLSNDNSLWKPHCEQKLLKSPVNSFKEQCKKEYFEKTLNPHFFPRYAHDPNILKAKCVLVGRNIHLTNRLMNICTPFFEHKQNREQGWEQGYFEYLHPLTKNKLEISVFRIKIDLNFAVQVKDAQCILLILSLETLHLDKALKDLEDLRKAKPEAFLAVYAIQDSHMVTKDLLGFEAFVTKIMHDGIIQAYEIIDLSQPTEAETAFNQTIATMIKAKAQTLPELIKEEENRPRLMM